MRLSHDFEKEKKEDDDEAEAAAEKADSSADPSGSSAPIPPRLRPDLSVPPPLGAAVSAKVDYVPALKM